MLLGALINSAFVVVGTIVGLLLKKGVRPHLQDGLTKAMGLVVVYLAIGSMLKEVSTMNVLLSMGIGTLLGEWLDLDGKMVCLGDWLEKCFRFLGPISKGFVQATLLFCVGSMGIIGSLESGLQNVHTTLTAKGIIDFICAIFIASENGIGVLFSAFALFIYQGLITVCARFLAPILTNPIVLNHISCVGGIILLSVGFNLLKIGKFKSLNFVIAILITIVLALCGV